MTAGSGAPGGGAPGATSGLGLGVGSGTAGTGMGQAAMAPMGFNMGNVSSSALGLGQGNAMGVGPAASPASSSTSSSTPVQNANQSAQNSNTVMGLSNQGQTTAVPTSVLANTTTSNQGLGFQVPPVNAVMSSTLGVPVTTTDGGFVTHGNLSGQVAGTPIMSSDVANAEMMNSLGDAASTLSVVTPSIVSAILGFFGDTASATTPGLVANTRGAIALAGPGMGAPSAASGGNPLTGTGHPMGLNTGSPGSTPSPAVTAPTTPQIQALIEAFAAAPQPQADPVTGIQPLSDPVQSTLIDLILQNALAQIEANKEFSPPIQNTTQQTVV
jgi:hypothetical protein